MDRPEKNEAFGFADIHCHMLAGIDDGAQTIEEMVELARLAHDEGTRTVCFTPHSGKHGKDADPEFVKKAFATASAFLKKKFPDMEFFLGNEIYYSCDIPDKIEEKRYYTINGSRYVLIEFSPGADLFNIESGVKFIKRAGYIPVLAHIERYKCVFSDADAIRNLRKNGAIIQVNSRCIIHRGLFGIYSCKSLLQSKLIDIVATDCHDTKKRNPNMGQCYDYISSSFGKEYADLLTKINPRLILADRPVRR